MLSKSFILRPTVPANLGEELKRAFSHIILTILLVSTLAVSMQPAKPKLSATVDSAYTPVFRSIETGSQRSDLREDRDFGRRAWRYSEFVELIVGVDVFKPEVRRLKEAILSEGGEVTGTILSGRNVQAVIARIPNHQASMFVERFRANGLARFVEPNSEVEVCYTPNDPYWSTQWGPQKIEADAAWDTTRGSLNVLMAIIDTGIDYTHTDLAANYVSLGYDWVNADADPLDDNGHGTHCAGIVAATLNNSMGIAGLAQVSLMTEKVLDSFGQGYYSWVAQGIYHAVDQGAKIISMSLGGDDDSQLLHEAVQYAHNHGVLVVASAGNNGYDKKLYPAAYEEVIAVSATDSVDNLASFSSFGNWIELAAPGVDVFSTLPGNSYDFMSGTSMACPHVSGVAALVWSNLSDYTRDQIRRLLQHTTDDLGDAGFDPFYGHGRINAGNAIAGLPEHDVGIFELQHPHRLDPGQSALFNVTILNLGMENETDVLVEFFVNNTLIDSAPIAFLEEGDSAIVQFSWSTTTIGRHNVTNYVAPVPEENSTENNVFTFEIFVRFPTTLRVPEEYSTIKAAVDAAGEDDTVLVDEGYYDEGQIDILKNHLKLVANGNASLDGWRGLCVFDVMADFVTIDGFDIRNCSTYGVRMKGCGNTIINNQIIHNRKSLYVYGSSWCNISWNYVHTHSGGVYVEHCSNCTISKNTIVAKSYEGGLHLSWSSSNTVSYNIITGGVMRIALEIYHSENNFILSNNIANNKCGLALAASPNNILRSNTMTNNTWNFGVWIEDVLSYPWQTVADVDPSNTVDGKPIYYLIDVCNYVVPLDAGCVVLVYCQNIKVENLTLRNNLNSIYIVNSSDIRIRFNNISFNNERIWNSLSGGIGAHFDCSNITITQNTLESNNIGVWVCGSNCNICRNQIRNSIDHGVLCDGSDNTVSLNSVSHGRGNGVSGACSGCIVSLNNITSNDCTGLCISGTNNTITSNNVIDNAKEWEGNAGIYLLASNSIVSRNNIISTNGPGINIWGALNNTIFHNNFINNNNQVINSNGDSENSWDNGYPSGGNCWSDYKGKDLKSGSYQNETGSDGVGDAPYTIDAENIDRFPLMGSWALPNIVAINVETSKTGGLPMPVVCQGRTVSINVTIQNQGTYIGAFDIAVYANATPVASRPVALTTKIATTFTFVWNTFGFAKGNYIISAHATPVPDETNTTDNTIINGWIFVTISGDVDGDRDVDIYDIVRMSSVYGVVKPDPRYDTNCDMDDDGDIDIYDIVIAVGNYGKSW